MFLEVGITIIICDTLVYVLRLHCFSSKYIHLIIPSDFGVKIKANSVTDHFQPKNMDLVPYLPDLYQRSGLLAHVYQKATLAKNGHDLNTML